MTALIRYALSLLGRRQSFIAPLLLFAVVLVVLTTNDYGALTDVYAACAVDQLVCMTWLTISLLNTEDPIQRTMTAVNAGSGRRVVFANTMAAVLICSALTVVGLGYPIAAGEHALSVAPLAVGAIAQLACGAVGIAIGLFCCRQMIPRQGFAVMIAVVLVGLMVTVPMLPPVGPLLSLLLSRDENAATMLAPVSGLAAISVAMLAGSYATVAAFSRRRD